MSEEDMNLSINGQSQVPPGFRFHPTEEELLHYYLRKKVAFEKIDLDVISEVDLNKLEPWDIQEKCKIGSTPQNDWYFFSHKDKKYPTGTRTNRATAAGFWKATGRDKIIYSGFRRIGLRKTLVFYKGRAPHGQKSDWIMHEYRLDESTTNDSMVPNPLSTDSASEDGWVVCRVFKKKNYQKSLDSPKALSISNLDSHSPNLLHHHLQNIPGATNDGVLDQILFYMGRTCKLENDQIHNIKNNSTNNIMSHHHHHQYNHHRHDDNDLPERFTHLPRLESPTLHPINPTTNTSPFKPNYHLHGYNLMDDILLETDPRNDEPPTNNNNKPSNDWVALDRLVASQLNGQDPNIATSSFCSPSPVVDDNVSIVQLYPYNSYIRSGTGKQSHHVVYEPDLWSNFAARTSPSPSSSDP